MSNLVERTAKSDFNLGTQPIRKGQIVNLDALQLDQLVAAGCVERSDALNALVPVASLPDTQRLAEVNAPVDAEQALLAEARQIADQELAELDRRTSERRAAALAELERFNTEHTGALSDARTRADTELSGITNEVTEARRKADAEIAEIQGGVSAARAAADAELAKIAQEVEDAKSKNKGSK
ncbi:hypothetical protein [Devosia sp. 1635]|uniref:hypothetical protein n=1 Tax=Devosia sp. 1635 TaxID=2726066 RepID=UPI0015668CBD|nr:hypothetical protein [Devosia sp. 1635]